MGRLGCGEGELGGGCATAVDVVSAHPSSDATAMPVGRAEYQCARVCVL